MENLLSLSKALGYLDDIPDSVFVDVSEARNIADNKITIITTGSQGEPMSALTRMAYDNHKSIKLKKNDIAFINSSRIHGYHASDDSDVIPLVRPILINPSLLSSNGYDIVQNKYISPLLTGELNLPIVLPADDPATVSIRKLLDRIADMFSEGAYGHEIQIKACLYDLLFQLLLPSKGNWTECSVASERSKVDSERFKQVLTFIYGHFNEKIRSRDMAEFMHMSEGHFSRYFKRMTQKTPIEYINEYKISEAAKLLRETDKKEIEIALDLGFDNFSYFISIFKRVVHCTPSQYRKNEQIQVQ